MNFKTVLLDKKHRKSSFTCEHDSLTEYIKEHAGQDMKRKLALCFVKVDSDNQVEGYYTLSNASIHRDLIPEDLRKRLGYRDIPVTLLGRLARDQTIKGQGLGELLLMDAMKRSLDASQGQSASFAIVTDPIDEQAEKFYRKYGFQKLEGSQRMFLMMKTMEGLF
jgi:predicted GNAT family N-acyltransferase